ncbi:Demethylmenaquinone methyltransferase [Pseudoclavibacter triregionum]|nr:Demethylmenaquinone methyltransferase [Pseudoclavibacter triregionum]
MKPDLSKQPEHVASMFDRVSPNYERMNNVMTLGSHVYWRALTRHAVAARPGERILDVAAGTGTMSAKYAADGAHVTALDFSQGMLDEARRRHGDDPRIEFVQGDATKLPFDDATFEATTVSFGIRNVNDPQAALREMRRVTKPGGRIVVCEFSRPVNAAASAFYDTWNTYVIPVLAKVASTDPEAYEYLDQSIDAWADQRTFAGWLREAGFQDVRWRNLSFGIVALHKGRVPVS